MDQKSEDEWEKKGFGFFAYEDMCRKENNKVEEGREGTSVCGGGCCMYTSKR